MRLSLSRHGQLTAAVGFVDDGHIEIIDGFKRMRAARALGWPTLRTQLVEIDAVSAKLMMAALHDARGLTELEEGWLVRSLYREHGMMQHAIAQRLGRHKTWVHRRLVLVEALDEAVQADVRLGLIAPRAAVAMGQLPRGNQSAARSGTTPETTPSNDSAATSASSEQLTHTRSVAGAAPRAPPRRPWSCALFPFAVRHPSYFDVTDGRRRAESGCPTCRCSCRVSASESGKAIACRSR
jgi:ParB/RepB/Spo0J family partition protein